MRRGVDGGQAAESRLAWVMLGRMPKPMPDHHDAELAIRVDELRREPVMRESRAAINQKFGRRRFEDVRRW